MAAKRSSYAKRIKATWVRKGKDKKLPAPADFTGLAKFSTTTYTNAAGTVVARSTSTFCPNTYQPVRRRPSARPPRPTRRAVTPTRTRSEPSGASRPVTPCRNGTYDIQIKANPAKVLYEKKTSNNVSYRKVVIGGTAGDRTVKMAKVGIINEPSPMDMESHATR